MRIVFDTNIFISHLLLPSSEIALLMQYAFRNHEILISEALMEELVSVAERPKFNRYLSPEDRNAFIAELYRTGIMVLVTDHISICRDPKDNMILELALSGKADMIVSGDKDILALNPFQHMPVITIQQCKTKLFS